MHEWLLKFNGKFNKCLKRKTKILKVAIERKETLVLRTLPYSHSVAALGISNQHRRVLLRRKNQRGGQHRTQDLQTRGKKMASTLLAFLAISSFHVCSAGVIQDGLTAQKRINDKKTNQKYSFRDRR